LILERLKFKDFSSFLASHEDTAQHLEARARLLRELKSNSINSTLQYSDLLDVFSQKPAFIQLKTNDLP